MRIVIVCGDGDCGDKISGYRSISVERRDSGTVKLRLIFSLTVNNI